MPSRAMMATANATPALTEEQLRATLTNNPQDNTEIPSLFQTFGPADDASGDDEDVEVLGANPAVDYPSGPFGGMPAHSGGRYGGPGVSSANRSSSTSTYGTASRNRHPLNRSSHNPYALLSSTDGATLYGNESATMQGASSSTNGRLPHRYSFSNSTSQNPLTFEFNASTTAVDGAPNVNSPCSNTVGPLGGQRRQSPQSVHAQTGAAQPPLARDPASEPADGYWRDGNPMSISSTEARTVATTSVGTLSTGANGETQSITVNVRQRVRAAGSSRGSSLSTSLVTMPVVQPAPRVVVGGANASLSGNVVVANAPLQRPVSGVMPDQCSPLSNGSGGRRTGNNSPSNTSDRRVPQQPAQQQPQQQQQVAGPVTMVAGPTPSHLMVNVPSSAVTTVEDGDERSINSGIDASSAGTPPLQHQQQQQQPLSSSPYSQYSPNSLQLSSTQPYYNFDNGRSMQQAYSPNGYGSGVYPAMAPPPGTYSHPSPNMPYAPHQYQHQQQQPQPQPQQQQQQQQYYNPNAQPSNVAMMQAGPGGYMNPYGQMAASPNYYMGSPNPAVGPGAAVMGGYAYPTAMPGMVPYNAAPAAAAQGGNFEQRGRRGGRGGQQQQQQRYGSGHGDSAAPSPMAQYAADGSLKHRNVKSNHGQQQQQQGPARQPKKGGAHPDAKVAAAASSENSAAASPTSGAGGRRMSKKQDEARFHANRDAAVQLFVVVKRKMEGQRYACALPASEVPVGSMMLVEGDRGADLGEVLAHVSVEQMARDCAVVERRRKVALEKMQEHKSAAAGTPSNGGADADGEEAEVPPLTGEAALDYVKSVRDWPWLIGPATTEDVASLAPQREAERQAFATAKPIVQQFIENRYQQRVARNEQALQAAAAGQGNGGAAEAAEAEAARDNSSDDGDHHAALTPLSAEELHTLELSRQVTLVDCEYQFTREKITLFVSRPSRSIFVDFRRMQRKLYRTFRCRIWIAYMDEIADDEDAPESFVFVPPPASVTTQSAAQEEAQ